MSCIPSKIFITSALLAIAVTGCTPSKPLYINDTGDLSYFVDQATKVEYADVEYQSLDEVNQAYPPITVIDPDFNNFVDLTLEDCISYGLSNSKVIRGYGTPTLQATRVSPGQDNLTNGPAVAGTTWDVAVRETEPGFLGQTGQLPVPSNLPTNTALDSNQGVESALADFDAQFTSSLTYTKSDEPRNGPSILSDAVFQQDFVQWQAEIAKRTASGTQILFRSINNYTANNNPLAPAGIQTLDSFYRASFEAEVRQPLLRGRGTFINRLPIVISRINTDQQITLFEATLQNMVVNIEIRYWDLYCAYRNFEAAKTGRDAALETFRIVRDQFDEGAEVNIQQVAQASEQYHFFDAQVIDAYNNLLNAEGQLRFLLGWSATDGGFIRPIDEPVMAPIEFDWTTSLCEALTFRPEIRQQQWEVKKRELAILHAKNGLLPELDVNILYRWLGLGNLFGTSGVSGSFPDVTSGALNELYGGEFQEVQLGATFAIPVGFRRAHANVRNAQLKLARELGYIEDLELDITRELTEALRALATNQLIMQSSFNRWKDTTVEVDSLQLLQDEGVETLDIALDAQRRRSQAEIAFYTAQCEYNKVIALIHRRKGTILPYSGIQFAEGPWPGKAYIDAQEHARRRGASRQINYGWSRPGVISRGENSPTADNIGNVPTTFSVPAPVNVPGEIITAPIEAAPFNNQLPTLEVLPDAIPAPILNEPATNGSTTRNHVPSGVRQVNYVEDIPPTQPNRNVSRGAKRATQPSNAAVKPVRDSSPHPVKRLQAKTQTQGQPLTTKRTLRTGNIEWEKLGLSKPTRATGQTTAKIKQSN